MTFSTLPCTTAPTSTMGSPYLRSSPMRPADKPSALRSSTYPYEVLGELDEVGVPEPADAGLQLPIGPLHSPQLLRHAGDALALGHQLSGRLDRHRPEEAEHQQDGDDLGAGSQARETDPSHRKGPHALPQAGNVLAPG